MSADRCPSCAAVVRADASWCGQCYADLRPAPAPAQAPAPVPAQPRTSASPDQQGAVASAPATLVAELPVEAVAPDPLSDPLPGVVPNAVETAATWPCGRCQTLVPIERDECPECYARFLDPALLGAKRTMLDRLPRGQRKPTTALLVIVGGGLALTGVFVGLFTLLAAIFG